MYRIAICDDSIRDLHATVSMTREYERLHQESVFEIHQYTTVHKLLEQVESGIFFDLYILDVLFPKGTGLEIALSIRKHQDDATVIFVTISPDFSLAAFEVLASRYLLKPLKRDALFEAIEYACLQINLQENKKFPFKTVQGICHVSHNDILYAECRARTIILKCRDNITLHSPYIRSTFEKEIAYLIEDSSFLQTYKSYVVNMNHIEHFSAAKIVLDNGDVVPIARSRKAKVKRKYLEYVSP